MLESNAHASAKKDAREQLHDPRVDYQTKWHCAAAPFSQVTAFTTAEKERLWSAFPLHARVSGRSWGGLLAHVHHTHT